MQEHKCRECGFKTNPQDADAVCGIFGHVIHLDGNACQTFNGNPYKCDICGRIIVESEIIVTNDDGSVKNIICESCSSKSGTCILCVHGDECSFKTDPSPLPHIIKKRIRAGQGIAVVDCPNPERIEVTCQKLCYCFDPEFGCNKQNNQTCGHFSERDFPHNIGEESN